METLSRRPEAADNADADHLISSYRITLRFDHVLRKPTVKAVLR
ncbi:MULTISPECIES: hypothetical protein [Rhizobium]|nr:hypothetical protein [Rhizobium phaseoli]